MSIFRNKLSEAVRTVVMGSPRPAGDYEKSQEARWLEATNPLKGLSVDRAGLIFDQARLGCYADLAWLYQEIEAADPTLFVCVERRSAGVQEIDWTVATKSAARVGRAWDAGLAAEQVAVLESALGACDNFLDGIEHLAGGFFRGFAHCVPRYSPDRLALRELECLDAWNFARNRATGAWHWNAKAHSGVETARLPEIPAGELVSLVRTRHIDYPALAPYIRAALGERKWGQFVERYGIPPVMIVMPEFADSTQEAAYMAAAQKVARGGSGALPFGAQVSYATEARGVNCFTDYLRHQQELTVLLATGGLATSLSMPTGLGEGPAGEHAATWRTIIQRDARIIAQAVNKRLTVDLLAAAFPGRPVLVQFRFDTEGTPSAVSIFDAAGKAVTAGYRIVQSELEEKTGYKLQPAETAAATAPAPGGAVKPVANKAAAQLPPEQELAAAAMDALSEAREKGLAPIVDRLADALAETDPARMRSLLQAVLDDLPGFVRSLAIPAADVDLVTRILSDAVGAGYQEVSRPNP